MKTFNTQQLAREWTALFAILAMLLGPLALGVSRSLGAQQRVAVAAGFSALPICAPGDALDGTKGNTPLASCDHCLPGTHGPVPNVASLAPLVQTSSLQSPQWQQQSLQLAATGLPPATGPPIS